MFDIIQRWGNFPLAYATLQDGLDYFHTPDGYIAYFHSKHVCLVLGDCVSKLENKPDILKRFLEQHPNASFFHVSKPTAKILKDYGYHALEMGVEHTLDLQDFKGTWSTHRSLRSGYNKAVKDMTVTEELLDTLPDSQIRKLVCEWLSKKDSKRLKSFLCRPISSHSEHGCRYFFARRHGQFVGFQRFTPLYNDGKLDSYYADFGAFDPKYSGVKDLLFYTAITQFQSEQFETLHLGLAPFSRQRWRNGLSPALFSLIYQLNFPAYGYKGISNYLDKFHAKTAPVYLMSRSRLPLQTLWNTWHVMSGSLTTPN